MEIKREANGTRFINVLSNNGTHSFHYIGISNIGVMLKKERQVNEEEFFIPNSYKIVTREHLHFGEKKEYTHDEFERFIKNRKDL